MRIPYAALALALCALPAHGDAALDAALQKALTPIDSTPLRADLVAVSGGETEALRALVRFVQSPATDAGVQLRAIRSLPQFCPVACVSAEAHAVVRQVILDNRDEAQGVGLLRLRAGIESLGAMRTGSLDDIALLVPPAGTGAPNLLDHPSRDIRATTARSLGNLCRKAAAGFPLQQRYASEQSPQVRLVIERAIAELESCPD